MIGPDEGLHLSLSLYCVGYKTSVHVCAKCLPHVIVMSVSNWLGIA